ncbi:MAG: hypothetical protein M1312_01055 [Patescibacteria group bacterium]|nr:hypothetical protein [Patescibacteria group bacterium]MDE2144933.1 hypothetical protein [Patescibacteria group bacterium]
MSKKLLSVIAGVVVLAAIIAVYAAYKNNNHPAGSPAGQTGNIISAVAGKPGWETMTESTSGISFEYPTSLNQTYVSTAIWPPKAEVVDQPFACAKTGSVTSTTGGTEKVSVNGRSYCKAEAVQTMAGSVYDRYVYAFPEGSNTATVAFALRFADCGTYNKTQRAACQNEQKLFSANNLADSIASTLVVK